LKTDEDQKHSQIPPQWRSNERERDFMKSLLSYGSTFQSYSIYLDFSTDDCMIWSSFCFMIISCF